MSRHINKVAVLGSGVMGSRIACHFANIGLEVVLLDIPPRELNDKEKAREFVDVFYPLAATFINLYKQI